MKPPSQKPRERKLDKEAPISMGQPRIDVEKALTLAADLEDQEIVRKLSLQKR